MKIIQLKAYEVMGSPDYYNCLVSFGNSKILWECQNYTRNGDKIRFGRLEPLPGMKLQVINKYVDPDMIVNVHIKE